MPSGVYKRKLLSPDTRFWPKVIKTNGCWEWIGARCLTGHGKFWYNKRLGEAHRFSYEIHVGSIPKGMVICHKCDNPPCVNPEHLFLGTMKDNSQDMMAKGRGKGQFTSKTHCKNGHELAGENIYISKSNSKVCRICMNAWRREWRANKKTDARVR